jgi:hypothetical protein
LHEQKLYQLIIGIVAAAFGFGLLWVLLGFSDQAPASDNDWQETIISAPDDFLAQYNALTEKPRWFIEKTAKSRKANEQTKVLDSSSPESLRLTGLVTQSNKRYALFLPVVTAGAGERPRVKQLSEGQALVGEWIIKSIGNGEVIIEKGDITQTLKMYQPVTNTKQPR